MKRLFLRKKPQDKAPANTVIMRKELPNERSLFVIVGFVLLVSALEFITVSIPDAFSSERSFHEHALLIVISFLLGGGLYHAFVYVYDRKGAVYPLFIAEIVAACLYLFAVCEKNYGLMIPREVMSVTALRAVSIITYIIAVTLTIIVSYMFLKKRKFDNIAKVYIFSLGVGVIVNIVILLPIKEIQELFVPQAMPVTLLIISQFLMIESHDQHYLSTRFLENYKREQELTAQNEALEILSEKRREMMATISHETRTPLAVISLYAGLIAAEMRAEGVSEQRAKDLDNIIEQIQNISEIMKQYSDFSQTSGMTVPVSAVEIVNRTAQVYKHILDDAGITLKVEFPDNLPEVAVHPGKLTQVLLNIMKNTANHSGATKFHIKAYEGERGFISFSIKDNGRGIPPDILPNIFKRGTTSGGEGIGLVVCKSIIETTGGEISVHNDNGAIISFSLPIFSEITNESESLTC
jgi:signal transduction histidine kinase